MGMGGRRGVRGRRGGGGCGRRHRRRPAAGGRAGTTTRRRQVVAARRTSDSNPLHGDRDCGRHGIRHTWHGHRAFVRRRSANEASTWPIRKATDLLAALDFGGVEKEDITTTNVFVYPQYGNDGRQITGYEAGNTVSVKIRTSRTPGRSSARPRAWSVTRSCSRACRSPSTTPARCARRRGGRLDQREDAGRATASASDLSLGDIVSIVEGSVPQIPVFRTEELAADAAGQRAARASQQELNLAVTVVYEPPRDEPARAAPPGTPVGSSRWASRRAITVSAQGKAVAVPDELTVSLGVMVTPPPLGRRCPRPMNGRGPPSPLSRKAASRRDLATADLTIWPEYGETRRVDAYQARNTLSVRLRDSRRPADCSTRWPGSSATTS